MTEPDDPNRVELYANVVELRPAEPPLMPRGRATCRHQAVIVDEEKHLVTCRRCSAELDAFHVLLEYANAERRFHCTSEARKADEARRVQRIAELRAEEQRIKARLRRARMKLK